MLELVLVKGTPEPEPGKLPPYGDESPLVGDTVAVTGDCGCPPDKSPAVLDEVRFFSSLM